MKRLFILFSVLFVAGITFAQQVQTTMYVVRGDAVTHEIPMSEVDSVVFQVSNWMPATAVTLNRESLTLAAGSSESLIASVTPLNVLNGNLTWYSNNPAVATVNADGLVTAVSAGIAGITVSTVNGEQRTAITVQVIPLPPNQTDAGVYLGEIDGRPIRWATRNLAAPGIFADCPSSSGEFSVATRSGADNIRGAFFQWNRIHVWHGAGDSGWNDTPESSTTHTWYPENDPCPPGWRVPTYDELATLKLFEFGWTGDFAGTGASGIVYGTYPRQLFLPGGGWLRGNGGVFDNGIGTWCPETSVAGVYWSSTGKCEIEHGMPDFAAHAFGFLYKRPGIDGVVDGLRWTWINGWRSMGYSIRCVAE